MDIIGILFLTLTIGLYVISRKLFEIKQRLIFSPIIMVPACIILIILYKGYSFQDYYVYTKYLVWMLGPITIAFAIPLYKYQKMIRAHFNVLLITSLVSLLVGLISSYGFAYLFSFDEMISKSLYVRSISIPFALTITEQLEGSLSLVPLFTVVTGLVGMLLGDFLLGKVVKQQKKSQRASLANGSAFGNGAHAMGVARAQQRSDEEAVIASLSLIISGVLLVLLSSIFSMFV